MSPNPQRTAAVSDEFNSRGARLVTVDGRGLPLRRVDIGGRAQGGLARITLEQRFQNPYPDPLRVTYQMPLPAEAAVSGYAFRIGARRIVGEVDRMAAARERFEEALLEGRTAGLLEQDRSSLFTQELGNIPPGMEVVAELVATLETGRPAAGRQPADAAYGLLTLTPPLPAARPPALPRDLIVLLDMSGSMAGEPLDQAPRVVSPS